MKQIESRWDIVNGLRVYSRLAIKNAPPGSLPLVLVHGLAVSGRYMLPLARQVAAYYPVYIPDLPGYGKSRHPGHVLNISELAETLCDWMDTQQLERVAMLANSMGCQTAARFALRYPERVEKLILVGPTVDPRYRTRWKQAASAFFTLFFEPLSLYPILLRDYLAAGPDEVFEGLGYAIEDPMEAYLPQVWAPTLVVRGAKDYIATQPWVATIANLLPNGHAVIIRGGAHAPNYDAPAALAGLVREFLS